MDDSIFHRFEEIDIQIGNKVRLPKQKGPFEKAEKLLEMVLTPWNFLAGLESILKGWISFIEVEL